MKVLVAWGTRLFFACTIGFTFPSIQVLFSSSAALQGLALAAAAVLGKSILAPFALAAVESKAAYTDSIFDMAMFAVAMNGRGEFSFLIVRLGHYPSLSSHTHFTHHNPASRVAPDSLGCRLASSGACFGAALREHCLGTLSFVYIHTICVPRLASHSSL